MNTKLKLAAKAYTLLILAGGIFSHVLLLTIRLIWGWQFFQAGLGKLQDIDSAVKNFVRFGIKLPKLNVIMASSTECIGGMLLLLGLGGRLVSVPLAITMIVAYLTAHRADIHGMDDFVNALPFPFLFTALVVLAFGPGKLSVDYLLQRFVFKSDRALDRP